MFTQRPTPIASLLMPSLLVVAIIAGVSLASSVTLPHTFVPGTVASADEVNANFTAIASAVNDNDSRITQNRSELDNIHLIRPRLAIKVDASANVESYAATSDMIPVVTRPNPGYYEIDLTNITALARAQFLNQAYLSATMTHGFGLSRNLEVQVGTLANGNEGIIVQIFSSTTAILVNHGFTLLALR